MRNITPWLWLALAGSVLQVIALGSDFYVAADGEQKDAWQGIPHASDLILLSAMLAVGLFAVTALGRNPIRGRSVGLVIGVVGLLATLQLGYRMIAPPFEGSVPANSGIIGTGCLYYCPPSEAVPADLLAGIWIGLVGCLAVTLGGLLHAFTRTARETPASPPLAPLQTGMTPWLGLAALGAVGQFVFGYTFFTFYITEGGEKTWSGWLPTPHTSSLVLAITLVVVGLIWAAARERSPLNPAALGGLIAVLGFVSTSRILFRIIEPPFTSSPADIGVAAYLALLSAALVLASGIVHAVAQQREAARENVSDRP
ncbi:MAG: hypothetical protein M3N45_04715 [Actinomycetota bacterium]|nr:hypothetical protein [Actinomycetota bacterium]